MKKLVAASVLDNMVANHVVEKTYLALINIGMGTIIMYSLLEKFFSSHSNVHELRYLRVILWYLPNAVSIFSPVGDESQKDHTIAKRIVLSYKDDC